MQDLDSQKKKLDVLYTELIECLNHSMNAVMDLKTNESKFSELKTDFIKAFTKNVKDAKSQMDAIKKNVVWDHLVIAFFGETNAGKSTIIETFRIIFNETTREKKLYRFDHPYFWTKFFRFIRNLFRKKNKELYQYGIDGDIVGDGSPDFTKQHKGYELHLEDNNLFTLIDVPGIEGNEVFFQKDVQADLLKAHCVFYVQGHNKQPDEATAIKIRKYLNEWVSVYAIYNVRSNADQYMDPSDRNTLMSENVKQVETLIQRTFSRLIGRKFKGTLCTQGLLALCSYARFSKKHEDLIRKQQKLIHHFGSADNIWNFSQFDKLKDSVDYMNDHYLDEIIEANKLKYIRVSQDIIKQINETIQEEKEKINSFSNGLHRFFDGIQSELNTTQTYIYSDVNGVIDKTFTDLNNYVFDCIEHDIKVEPSKLQKRAKIQLKAGITESLTKRINNLNQDIKDMKRDLDNNDELSIGRIVISPNIPNINLNKAMDELGIHWSDVFSFGSTVANLAITGVFFGPVGAAIGCVLGGVFGLVKYSFGDGGKGKAKAKASEELDQAKQLVRQNLNGIIDGINKKINSNVSDMTNKLNKEIVNLASMNSTIDNLKREITIKANNLKTSHYGTI